jgi:antitoxin component YwqK of YwqJK toxin-antitoxin module
MVIRTPRTTPQKGSDTMNNDGSSRMEQITKVVSYVKDGLLTIYYRDSEEKASEVCRQDGTVIHRSGTVPDGIVNEYYSNGKLHRSAEFKNGSEQGLCIEYYPGGQIFEKNHYRRGVLHGPSNTYRQDGLLWMEANYRNGNLHGPFTAYFDDGAVENRTEYMNGRLHGPYVAYNRHGIVVEEGKFVRGKKQGTYRIFHETGYPSRVENYRQGKLVSCTEFDESGNAVSRCGPGREDVPEGRT